MTAETVDLSAKSAPAWKPTLDANPVSAQVATMEAALSANGRSREAPAARRVGGGAA